MLISEEITKCISAGQHCLEWRKYLSYTYFAYIHSINHLISSTSSIKMIYWLINLCNSGNIFASFSQLLGSTSKQCGIFYLSIDFDRFLFYWLSNCVWWAKRSASLPAHNQCGRSNEISEYAISYSFIRVHSFFLCKLGHLDRLGYPNYKMTWTILLDHKWAQFNCIFGFVTNKQTIKQTNKQTKKIVWQFVLWSEW